MFLLCVTGGKHRALIRSSQEINMACALVCACVCTGVFAPSVKPNPTQQAVKPFAFRSHRSACSSFLWSGPVESLSDSTSLLLSSAPERKKKTRKSVIEPDI